MMNQTPILFETLDALLDVLAASGLRYRLWHAGSACTPHELRTLLQTRQSPLLHTGCEARVQTATMAGVTRTGWHIHLLTASVQHASTSSPFFLEDLLAIDTVLAWLHQQGSQQGMAVLQPGTRASTFLDGYFQQVVGLRPDLVSQTRFPVWYGFLEDLIAGLDPSGQHEQITVSATTLLAWLETIAAVFADGRESGGTLDDAEETWQDEQQEHAAGTVDLP